MHLQYLYVLPEGFSGRCNFEFDLCSWRQRQDDDFDWLIKAGNMFTPRSGPSTDHTLRNPSGHYLYLEGSFPQTTGHTAQIIGPLFSRYSKDCKVSVYCCLHSPFSLCPQSVSTFIMIAPLSCHYS